MSKPDLTGKIELDEVLLKAKQHTNNFIEHLEKEEDGDRLETTESIQNQMIGDKIHTDKKKHDFIEDMKSGLGKEIKGKKGYGVKLIGERLGMRIRKFFLMIYSKF